MERKAVGKVKCCKVADGAVTSFEEPVKSMDFSKHITYNFIEVLHINKTQYAENAIQSSVGAQY